LGTITIPYGFTSPFDGTVVPSDVTFVSDARKAPEPIETVAEALAAPLPRASSKQTLKLPSPTRTPDRSFFCTTTLFEIERITFDLLLSTPASNLSVLEHHFFLTGGRFAWF